MRIVKEGSSENVKMEYTREDNYWREISKEAQDSKSLGSSREVRRGR